MLKIKHTTLPEAPEFKMVFNFLKFLHGNFLRSMSSLNFHHFSLLKKAYTETLKIQIMWSA